MTDVFADTTVVTPDPVTELVGEGKKFKTVEDLAKGKIEADKFINDLKAEMAELRSHLEGQTKLDELKQEIQELRAQREGQPKPQTGDALSAADIKALVTKAITDTERSRSSAQNIQDAQSAVIEKLGTAEKASEFIVTKAKELGVSTEELKGIASRSPTAFLKMLDVTVEPGRSETFVTRGTVTTGTDIKSGSAPKEGTWEYFENIKKTKGVSAYFSPAVQNALHKAVFAGTAVVPNAA